MSGPDRVPESVSSNGGGTGRCPCSSIYPINSGDELRPVRFDVLVGSSAKAPFVSRAKFFGEPDMELEPPHPAHRVPVQRPGRGGSGRSRGVGRRGSCRALGSRSGGGSLGWGRTGGRSFGRWLEWPPFRAWADQTMEPEWGGGFRRTDHLASGMSPSLQPLHLPHRFDAVFLAHFSSW